MLARVERHSPTVGPRVAPVSDHLSRLYLELPLKCRVAEIGLGTSAFQVDVTLVGLGVA